jgi:hypothetical protein
MTTLAHLTSSPKSVSHRRRGVEVCAMAKWFTSLLDKAANSLVDWLVFGALAGMAAGM